MTIGEAKKFVIEVTGQKLFTRDHEYLTWLKKAVRNQLLSDEIKARKEFNSWYEANGPGR